MLNQVILVGRIVYDPELRTLEDGRNVTTITLAIQRPFKHPESGEYETDFIKCSLWSGMAKNTVNYCKKGSVIGVKARLAQKYFEYENDKGFSYPEVIAEKITFINTKKEQESEKV